MSYDSQNVFARILRGELPCKKLYEDAYALAFPDIAPKAPTHVLVIPKGAYENCADFAARATEAEIVGFARAVQKVIEQTGIAAGGYRVIANTGLNGGQEVPHYHVHIVGGGPLGPMLSKA